MARFYRVTVTDMGLRNIPVKIDRAVEDALDTAVISAIEAADPQTRVDTGALRANKDVVEGSDLRIIRWLQDYAAYQDQGTVYMSGTFFTVAAAQAGTRALNRELSRLRLV